MLSSGEGGVIIWDNMLSSECNVIISRGGGQMLSSGEGVLSSGMITCYHLSVVLSSECSVIISGGGEGKCYHLWRGVLSSGMITCYHLRVVLSYQKGGMLSSVEGAVII